MVFSANYSLKLFWTPQMPPKTRTSGRLTEKQNKKRKVDEIEEDLSKEERPKKKAKILVEKKEKKSQKVEEIAKATITNDEKNDAEINLADQPPVEGGRPSRRAKKVAVSKIVKTVPEDPNKSAEELAQKQRALQRLTTLKEQRQIAPRIEDEEYTLPDELILQIFSCLKRRDLYSIGATCRQWHRLSNDHSLGWHLALSLPLIEAIGVYTYYEGK
jgi:flagellar biosynthesis chaperone FliJ